MKTIDDINFSGEKVLLRVDFNVPLDNFHHISDDSRIKAALPTISKILKDGGSVVLMSHLGRPKQGYEEKFSLSHLVAHVSRLLNKNVRFAQDCIGPAAQAASADLQTGEILLLENLRFHKEEEKGDEEFASKLANLGSVYVNDAFGSAHRAHASTSVIAKFFPGKKFMGYLMAGEIKNADKVLKEAERPFTAILGGAKVSDKISLISKLLDKVDKILIGGGMAYTFIKANGGEIGSSMLEQDKLELSKEILQNAKGKNVEIMLPVDTVSADKFDNNANTQINDADKIPNGWMGLDIGPETIKLFSEEIKKSKTILWNGPVGVFEMSKFDRGTRGIAESIARATEQGAFSLIGGGDSAAAINKFGYDGKVSYVSTGGGALLEYFEGRELPGIKMIMGN
jgi:phosphoglycerate kinase